MIDIIIVTYNKLDFFLEKNKKFFNNSKIRFIIIDNNNQTYNQKYKNIYYIHNEENLGYGKAINIAMKYCNTNYVIIANDDIIFNENIFINIEKKKHYYKKEKISVIGCNVSKGNNVFKFHYGILPILYNFSFIPKVLSLFSKQNGYTSTFATIHYAKSSKFVKGVSGACFLINRKDFYFIGEFDPKFFLTYEETDLFLRLLKNRKRIYYDNDLKVYHKHSITANKESQQYAFTSMKIFLKKYYNNFIYKSVSIWIFTWLLIKNILTIGKNINEIKYFLKK